MLKLLDVLLTILHLVIILFNLFGWMFSSTRKLHLISIILTAASWFILGIWFGMGYCPITDWQWNVKEKLGEHNLPSNFIEYFAEKISGRDFSSQLIDTAIAVCFALAAILSVYVNFIRKHLRHNVH
jgi:hypothetical protein